MMDITIKGGSKTQRELIADGLKEILVDIAGDLKFCPFRSRQNQNNGSEQKSETKLEIFGLSHR